MKAFKVVVIGNSTVGKTCILNRVVCNEFTNNTEVTVGNAYLEKVIKRDKDQSIKLRLFDTAGQERYRSVTRYNYRGADAALLVFDVTNQKSFDDLDEWIKDLQANAPSGIKLFVLGNKIDLEQIIYDKTIEGISKDEVINIRYVSAKTGDGIFELIDDVVKTLDPVIEPSKIHSNVKEELSVKNSDVNSSVKISMKPTIKTRKGCC